MTDIVFSPDAVKDLEQTEKYIAEDLQDSIAAKNTVIKIVKSIRALSEFPLSGALLEEIVGFETAYRYLICVNYTAFYRYDSNKVFVIRILYGKRDFMRILFSSTDE